jgi:hypothetical protein
VRKLTPLSRSIPTAGARAVLIALLTSEVVLPVFAHQWLLRNGVMRALVALVPFGVAGVALGRMALSSLSTRLYREGVYQRHGCRGAFIRWRDAKVTFAGSVIVNNGTRVARFSPYLCGDARAVLQEIGSVLDAPPRSRSSHDGR